MKRWLVGLLLVVLAGVLLVSVINNNRDPIAVLEEFGATNEKKSTTSEPSNEMKRAKLLKSFSIVPTFPRRVSKSCTSSDSGPRSVSSVTRNWFISRG